MKMITKEILKYPRTKHVQGSRLQRGDHDLEAVSIQDLYGKHLIIEEKMDGSNVGISFDDDGTLLLQSRGHYLRGGPREKQYAWLKQWSASHHKSLFRALGTGYVMYGENLYAKHTAFYDALPHYFMEFDLYDKETGDWASTPRRMQHYVDTGVDSIIFPVLVIAQGDDWTLDGLRSLVGRSNFRSPSWLLRLREEARRVGQDPKFVEGHTDTAEEMEGLYIKWEEGDKVLGRYKFVRESFTNSIMDQETHWIDRTIVPNVLLPGAYERMFQVC